MTSPHSTRPLQPLLVATLVGALALPLPGQARQVEEDPSGLAMTADLVIARPVGLVTTALGSVLYVASLPFTLAGGNAKAAANTLVLGPARTTFVRCLGCTQPGYQRSEAGEPTQ